MLLQPGAAYSLSQVGAETVIDLGHGDQLILDNVQLASRRRGGSSAERGVSAAGAALAQARWPPAGSYPTASDMEWRSGSSPWTPSQKRTQPDQSRRFEARSQSPEMASSGLLQSRWRVGSGRLLSHCERPFRASMKQGSGAESGPAGGPLAGASRSTKSRSHHVRPLKGRPLAPRGGKSGIVKRPASLDGRPERSSRVNPPLRASMAYTTNARSLLR